ncbi:cysteine-rich repeat secretory protein 38-like [Telopea speciosissima]|uniref:cysteine-rich repeat secretory protein 38-like n=1 Tax=Telopea speciosissima TaxID=54955 RepID=UPI001CC62EC6|nr:cysteine-rich repeat secretory protein 38-like [Telopea speciosissima]
MSVKDSPPNLLLFLSCLLVITINGSCSADPLLSFCTNPAQYKQNSTFESNLKLLLLYLSSNTSVSGGFYNTSVGNGTDHVYGLALCRGDVTRDVCQNCMENASREILSSCPMKEDAIIWYEYCQLRYSYQNFFSVMVYAGKYPPWNDQQRNVSNPYKFSQILNGLLNELISQVASLNSDPMFAIRDASASGIGKVVGRAQCTWDISRGDCENCLRNAMGDLEGYCSTRQGGMILDSSCDLMFQVLTSNGK